MRMKSASIIFIFVLMAFSFAHADNTSSPANIELADAAKDKTIWFSCGEAEVGPILVAFKGASCLDQRGNHFTLYSMTSAAVFDFSAGALIGFYRGPVLKSQIPLGCYEGGGAGLIYGMGGEVAYLIGDNGTNAKLRIGFIGGTLGVGFKAGAVQLRVVYDHKDPNRDEVQSGNFSRCSTQGGMRGG